MNLNFFIAFVYVQIILGIMYFDRKKNGKYESAIGGGEAIVRVFTFSWNTRFHYLFIFLLIFLFSIVFLNINYRNSLENIYIPSVFTIPVTLFFFSSLIYVGFREARNVMKK